MVELGELVRLLQRKVGPKVDLKAQRRAFAVSTRRRRLPDLTPDFWVRREPTQTAGTRRIVKTSCHWLMTNDKAYARTPFTLVSSRLSPAS